jgi:hypothetical protein
MELLSRNHAGCRGYHLSEQRDSITGAECRNRRGLVPAGCIALRLPSADEEAPVHADMPHEVTVIKGRRFPTCRHCKGISFELTHVA